MNQVHPKVLLYSKWTKVNVVHKEKHFLVTEVEFDESHKVNRGQFTPHQYPSQQLEPFR